MFLAKLNDKEKRAFMSLAKALALADGIVVSQEEKFMNLYAKEMDLTDYDFNSDIDSVIKELADSATDEVKRIVILELVELANADGNFSGEEKDLVKKVIKAFGLNEKEIDKCVGEFN